MDPLGLGQVRGRRPDLADPEVRERLTPAALGALFRILEAWEVPEAEACGLLGDVAPSTLYKYKAQGATKLGRDQLERISYLIGIFKALHILFGPELADRWPRLPNQNRLFAGKTPVEYMVREGIPGLHTVRRLLDARRGGR